MNLYIIRVTLEILTLSTKTLKDYSTNRCLLFYILTKTTTAFIYISSFYLFYTHIYIYHNPRFYHQFRAINPTQCVSHYQFRYTSPVRECSSQRFNKLTCAVLFSLGYYAVTHSHLPLTFACCTSINDSYEQSSASTGLLSVFYKRDHYICVLLPHKVLSRVS